jgi:hypothetical protein
MASERGDLAPLVRALLFLFYPTPGQLHSQGALSKLAILGVERLADLKKGHMLQHVWPHQPRQKCSPLSTVKFAEP